MDGKSPLVGALLVGVRRWASYIWTVSTTY